MMKKILAAGITVAAMKKLGDRKREKTHENMEGLTEEELAEVCLASTQTNIKLKCIDCINDEALLGKILLNDADYKTRIMAAGKLSMNSPSLLKAACEDDNGSVARECVQRMDEPALLAQVLHHSKDDGARRMAAGRLPMNSPHLLRAAREDKSYWVRADCLKRIDDQAFLLEMIKTNPSVREACIANLQDQRMLRRLATHDRDRTVREKAMGKVKDQQVLRNAALKDADASVRIAAIQHLEDQKVLERIVFNDKLPWGAVREAAVRRISDTDTLFAIACTCSPHLACIALQRLPHDSFTIAWKKRLKSESNSPHWLAVAALSERFDLLMEFPPKQVVDILRRDISAESMETSSLDALEKLYFVPGYRELLEPYVHQVMDSYTGYDPYLGEVATRQIYFDPEKTRVCF